MKLEYNPPSDCSPCIAIPISDDNSLESGEMLRLTANVSKAGASTSKVTLRNTTLQHPVMEDDGESVKIVVVHFHSFDSLQW